jgi:hypothetical protein
MIPLMMAALLGADEPAALSKRHWDCWCPVWTEGSASIPAVFGMPLDALDRSWRESLRLSH